MERQQIEKDWDLFRNHNLGEIWEWEEPSLDFTDRVMAKLDNTEPLPKIYMRSNWMIHWIPASAATIAMMWLSGIYRIFNGEIPYLFTSIISITSETAVYSTKVTNWIEQILAWISI